MARSTGVKAGFNQACSQRLVLKVEWNKGKLRRIGKTSLVQHAALPILRGGKVHFKDAKARKRVAPGEGVKPGSQHHILIDPKPDGLSELVFHEAAAGGHECPKVTRHTVLRPFHVALEFRPNQPNRDRIVQNRRPVHDLVGGAAQRHTQSCLAGAAFLHLLQFK